MTVLEKHAMEEVNVMMALMTIYADAMMDILAKTAKQVCDCHDILSV